MTDPIRRGRYRILVADDDLGMRSLVAEALREDGFMVEAIATGADLLSQLSAELFNDGGIHFDLVVSDIRMPLISGLEMLEALREVHCQLDFILMTAFGDEHCHDEAARLGAVAILDKPFHLSTLRGMVHERFMARFNPARL